MNRFSSSIPPSAMMSTAAACSAHSSSFSPPGPVGLTESAATRASTTRCHASTHSALSATRHTLPRSPSSTSTASSGNVACTITSTAWLPA